MHKAPSNAPLARIVTTAAIIVVMGLGTLGLFRFSHGSDQPTSAKPVAKQLELKRGQRIVIVGNTLAERMQYFGQWETLLHSRFPELELVVRNLGWSADELTIRLRSKDFQDHGHSLASHQADVVLAMFGLNESFAGKAGLAKFERDLEAFVRETTTTAYNGKSPPRLVLISPIAAEQLREPTAPKVSKVNANLRLYVEAMRGVAAKHNVPFVDLFEPTLGAMTVSNGQQEPLTINGIHLNERGDAVVGEMLDRALFGERPSSADGVDLDKLRAEVNEKNLQFFYDHRAVNGYYIYGGRKAPFGIINFPEEFKKLRKMIAVRDRRVWDVAQGNAVLEKIDDADTGPLPTIETNVNRPVEITSAAESAKRFTLPDGYQIELFASEEQFPELKKPVALTFDARGRLWVATMPSYPHYSPGIKPDDKVLILEDTDGDGRADACKTFADGLYLPTGLELGHGGLYLAQEPNLMFLKDTDGDDVADERKLILHGFDSADSHHAMHTLIWDPGMALYFQEGTFHQTQVETPQGPVRCSDAGVFRFEPRTSKLGVFVSYRFANPWGHCFDRWGQNFVADASTGLNYFAAPFSGDVDYPEKHGSMNTFQKMQWRPTSGCELVSSRHFPKETQGDFLINNCIGFQGTLQYRMREEGSGFAADPVEPLLRSADPNFRPVDMEFAPDGSLYIVDWFNPLIGHMQHSLRDPNRDTAHGRIWRITHKDRPLVEPAKIAGEPIPALLDLLKTYEDRTRYRARIELSERDTGEVMAALDAWIAKLDGDEAMADKEELQRQLLEALWVRQQHSVVDERLLHRLLRSPEPKARAAAVRVLCYWRDSVSTPLELLREAAVDDHPRVRLEAVRALSFFRDADVPQALEILAAATNQPQDYYLKYTIGETDRTLKRRLNANERQIAESSAATPSSAAESSAANLIDLPISPAEMKQLVAEVLEKGNAERGEAIFRREKLTCIKCHAISKAGGDIGPDLSAVGQISPVDFLIHSLLNPSLAIKEQYETKQFVTDDGRSFSGIVVDRNYAQVKLKDQDGKIVTIRNRDIELERDGRSLMPVGLTKDLKHEEFLDLVRFLGELGRPGPFAISERPTVQRWRVLKQVPESLNGGSTSGSDVLAALAATPASDWQPIYATVAGRVPLGEARGHASAAPGDANGDAPIYLYGEINVTVAGSVKIALDAPAGTVVGLGGETYRGESLGQIEQTLEPGMHRLWLQVPSGSDKASIRAELIRLQGSKAQFEPVGGV